MLQFRLIHIKWQYIIYTLCNFNEDGTVTPEITRLETNFLVRYGKCQSISLDISESTGPSLTKFSALVDIRVGIIKLAFVLWSLKGRCYGNQLTFGPVR